jgi:hypothetical protein
LPFGVETAPAKGAIRAQWGNSKNIFPEFFERRRLWNFGTGPCGCVYDNFAFLLTKTLLKLCFSAQCLMLCAHQKSAVFRPII